MKKVIAILVGLLLLLAIGCDDGIGSETSSSVQKAGQRTQADLMAAANAVEPPYKITEFTAREDINIYLRETEGRQIWFVYAYNAYGDPLFYVVSDMKPRNICVSLTNPDQRLIGRWGNVVTSAPALDGVYYGGAGCDAYYLRDATTGNFIELAGRTFSLISSKVPLDVQAEELRAASSTPVTQPVEPTQVP